MEQTIKTGSALVAAALMLWSPAIAADLHIEPCHTVMLRYDTKIDNVHLGDSELADAVPVGDKMLALTAKRETHTQTVEQPNKTITNTYTLCASGKTNLTAFDADGHAIVPSSSIPADSLQGGATGFTEILVAPRGRIINVHPKTYYLCEPDTLCVEKP